MITAISMRTLRSGSSPVISQSIQTRFFLLRGIGAFYAGLNAFKIQLAAEADRAYIVFERVRNYGRRPMRIVIPGGSGHLGTLLATDFHRRGDEVVVLSRSPRLQPWAVEPWSRAAFDGADVVINLAGRSVMCRYDEAHKREIIESRVETTREVGE